MPFDASTLENIYRMMTPADLLGAQKINDTTKKVSVDVARGLLDAIYGVQGALSVDDLAVAIDTLAKNGDATSQSQLKAILQFYSNGSATISSLSTSQNMATDTDGKTPVTTVTFDQIVGPNLKLDQVVPPAGGKKMGIITLNSAYLSPACRNAERVELFMNYMPSIMASRMVPLLDIEFAFSRPNIVNLQSPGLLKFLLGADPTAISNTSDATYKMIKAREVTDTTRQTLHTTAGMEMFTSPQTLTNMDTVAAGARYVDVLDPFRPLMSIESFTVNVTPTVGLYSYKKATLVMKLHDRSRLSEISDIIRPQIYQDSVSAPTVWITYGWRHPAEPGGADVAGSGTYADFINGNMLVREAYGIINTQFAFDQVGQVTLTMELWTKGMPEMRTAKTNDDHGADLQTVERIRRAAEKITRYANILGINPAAGVNREVRGSLLIESAERGSFPDMSTPEIQSALSSLEASFKVPGGQIDKAAADALITELKKFYSSSDKKNLDFKDNLDRDATQAAFKKLKEVTVGVDPFLPTAAKDTKRQAEAKTPAHPYVSLVEAINAYKGEADVAALIATATKLKLNGDGFKKKLVSFGKLVSVFLGSALSLIDGIDEMQLFFYQLNDHAGAAASTNIAEFPIDMPVFLDQYREHVARKGTERLSIEEFLRLVVDAQLSDTRAVGYGFRSFFAPYDPANKHDAKTKDNTQQAFENALAGIGSQLGPFRMPVVEFYVETTYSNKTTNDRDALHTFENIDPEGAQSDRYLRIMRIHVFDKTNNPYKLPGTLLRGDDTSDAAFVEIPNSYVDTFGSNLAAAAAVFANLIPGLKTDGTIDRTTAQGVSNQQIKAYVSKMVPSIIYGGNASSVISANLASKQDPLMTVAQQQFVAKKSGKPSVAQPNGGGSGGLPLRIIPASMTMTTLGCPLLTFGQLFFIDFNTGTTVDNLYGLTGITHTITPGKFESNLTLTFYDAYGRFEGAPTLQQYMTQLQVPSPKK